jgi:hypothetical protein
VNSLLPALFALLPLIFRTRAIVQAKNLGVRHQSAVLQASAPHWRRLRAGDRLLRLLISKSGRIGVPVSRSLMQAGVTLWAGDIEVDVKPPEPPDALPNSPQTGH